MNCLNWLSPFQKLVKGGSPAYTYIQKKNFLRSVFSSPKTSEMMFLRFLEKIFFDPDKNLRNFLSEVSIRRRASFKGGPPGYIANSKKNELFEKSDFFELFEKSVTLREFNIFPCFFFQKISTLSETSISEVFQTILCDLELSRTRYSRTISECDSKPIWEFGFLLDIPRRISFKDRAHFLKQIFFYS